MESVSNYILTVENAGLLSPSVALTDSIKVSGGAVELTSEWTKDHTSIQFCSRGSAINVHTRWELSVYTRLHLTSTVELLLKLGCIVICIDNRDIQCCTATSSTSCIRIIIPHQALVASCIEKLIFFVLTYFARSTHTVGKIFIICNWECYSVAGEEFIVHSVVETNLTSDVTNIGRDGEEIWIHYDGRNSRTKDTPVKSVGKFNVVTCISECSLE